jgi:hypothetical protein
MDKLSKMSLRTTRTNWANFLRYSNHSRQAKYEDKFLANDRQNLKFEHTWGLMGHMHDLRVWTLAYAPSNRNNM